jgi:redox-sensitive bicupin YhaK (pirin superfamily)
MTWLEVTTSREVTVGAMPVRRALPRKGHRCVGAWCFADHMGPAKVSKEHGLDIGPHPHMGLQTVTYLIDGEALHRDSLGTEQLITPGQLNLMTAGEGVSHSEEATRQYEGTLQGIQLWIAQPEATRHLAPAFEHHGELPRIEMNDTRATVLIGEFCGVTSSARDDAEVTGTDLKINGRVNFPLRTDFEYGAIVLEGSLMLNGVLLQPGHLGYLAPGNDQIEIDALEPSRVILLGGVPFESEIQMWWNFVARNRNEIDQAFNSWRDNDGRFGTVASELERIDTVAPFWRAGKDQ